MKSRLINAAAGSRTYALVFADGDEVVAELMAFAGRERLTAASFKGIGAFRSLARARHHRRVRRRVTCVDAIVKKIGGDVFINVPKLVVGKMGWEEPPSAAEHEAKRGPRAGDVEQLYGSRGPSTSDAGGDG